jgi:hypothetical protein
MQLRRRAQITQTMGRRHGVIGNHDGSALVLTVRYIHLPIEVTLMPLHFLELESLISSSCCCCSDQPRQLGDIRRNPPLP